ncbi:MAG: TadE family protein [Acidimicrobiales bacterium]
MSLAPGARGGGPPLSRGPRASPAGWARGDRGQAAVEVALVLPLITVLALALLQVAVVVRDQVLVTHAAREGAREAAVSSAPGAARQAALAGARLVPARLRVEVSGRDGPGSRVRVVARYSAPTDLPVVGALVGDVTLTASATMRVER